MLSTPTAHVLPLALALAPALALALALVLARHPAPATNSLPYRRPLSHMTRSRRQAVSDRHGRRGTSGQRSPHLPSTRQLGRAGAGLLVLVGVATRPTNTDPP